MKSEKYFKFTNEDGSVVYGKAVISDTENYSQSKQDQFLKAFNGVEVSAEEYNEAISKMGDEPASMKIPVKKIPL